MPSLSIPNTFTSFTKIRSADMNANFAAITTLLNTTKLDDTNIQNAGITRSTKLKAGTANYVIINDGSGNMSEEAQLALSRGGTGLAIIPGNQSAGDVLQINAGLTAFSVGPVPSTPPSRVYNYYRFN